MPNTVKIMTVTDVNLFIYKTNPPTLNIHAEGLVPSAGYTNGRLVPYVYVTFPPDGIWDFDFVADRPEDSAADIIFPIATDYMWHDYPQELKGVRIHSSTNYVEKKLSESKEKPVKTELVEK